MKYIIIVLVIIHLTSCITRRDINIEVRNPAIVTFPSNITNLSIVNNLPHSIEATTNDSLISQNSNNLKINSAQLILERSLTNNIRNENFFNKINIYKNNIKNSEQPKTSILNPTQIQKICNDSNTDALLSIDFFSMYGEYSKRIDYYTMRTYNILKMKTKIILNIYTAEGIKLTRPLAYIDSLYWNDIENPELPSIKEAAQQILKMASESLVNSIIPSWSDESRFYYADNSKLMKQADKLAKQNKWVEAANIWGKIYDKHPSKIKKIRLALNLALANENIDDINNAVNWINVAYNMVLREDNPLLFKQVITYRKELLKRKKIEPILQKQLGLK